MRCCATWPIRKQRPGLRATTILFPICCGIRRSNTILTCYHSDRWLIKWRPCITRRCRACRTSALEQRVLLADAQEKLLKESAAEVQGNASVPTTEDPKCQAELSRLQGTASAPLHLAQRGATEQIATTRAELQLLEGELERTRREELAMDRAVALLSGAAYGACAALTRRRHAVCGRACAIAGARAQQSCCAAGSPARSRQ